MNTGPKQGPALRRHKRSGNGYARFNGRQIWFGQYDDQQTHAHFAAFKARWEASNRQIPEDMGRGGCDEDYLVRDLIADYLVHLEQKHDAGWLHRNLDRIRLALRPVLELYGPNAVPGFTARSLQMVRSSMVATKRLCRREINSRVFAIRRAFRWAVAEEKAPASSLTVWRLSSHCARGTTALTRAGQSDPSMRRPSGPHCPT